MTGFWDAVEPAVTDNDPPYIFLSEGKRKGCGYEEALRVLQARRTANQPGLIRFLEELPVSHPDAQVPDPPERPVSFQ